MTPVLMIVAALVVIFFILIATRTNEMSVSREMLIRATPEKIFPYINNSKKADEWMPWKDSDPGVQMQYSGPSEGLGSKSSWNSKGKMGTGEALVIESKINTSVKTQLTYTKPFSMSQVAEISLVASSEGTKVTWSVSGKNNFFFKLMGLFVNCDKMIGSEFEKGLTKLKSLVEV